ncbi:hypothetical protein ACFFYR_16155 [Paraburkholderia dipogonis]|uniref:hypothetical protein n=1 Tax=Paraburkholderia dipogonis TaxID=1211383 RepID=UPI0035EAF80D
MQNVEGRNGIVFLDEIDKIASRATKPGGGEVFATSVRAARNLLMGRWIEGHAKRRQAGATKYGMVKTDQDIHVHCGCMGQVAFTPEVTKSRAI